jgi:hypothetical protein
MKDGTHRLRLKGGGTMERWKGCQEGKGCNGPIVALSFMGELVNTFCLKKEIIVIGVRQWLSS